MIEIQSKTNKQTIQSQTQTQTHTHKQKHKTTKQTNENFKSWELSLE